jgi:hypothetical protein
MPDQFFYTAIFRPSTGEVLRDDHLTYAEHFVDEAEMRKRAKQFESHARSLGEDAPWMVYMGKESFERNRAREDFRAYDPDAETPEQFYKEMDAEVAKITKTASILTAPEVDDSQEARPLPAWAVAQADVERAELAVKDAQDGVDEAQKRADAIIDRVFSTSPDRPAAVAAHAEWETKTLMSGAPGADLKVAYDDRRQAVAASLTVDQQKGRLYLAQEDLKAKREVYDALKAEADEQAALAAQG